MSDLSLVATEPPAEAVPQNKKIKDYDVAVLAGLKFSNNLIKQEKNIFYYTGTHWKELTEKQQDEIKEQMLSTYIDRSTAGSNVKFTDIKSAWNLFVQGLDHVPDKVNLFDPHPFCANFLNGTLHLRHDKDFNYKTEFLPHNKLDFVNTVLPYEYSEDLSEENDEFNQMLSRLFEGDPDSGQKIEAIAQMFGACLVPAFPHLFFLHGPPACGKSTLILLASKLVSEDNTCSVSPSEMVKFNMESMVGKLVNFDTDVPTNAAISDAKVKKIIDRQKIRIERKGRTDLYGYLPAIHIFGGNGIPPTLEGATGAHERRWTFVELKNVQAKGLYNKEYHQWVFEKSPRGILNFALRGLGLLLAFKGHYKVIDSGKKTMDEWQASEDPFAQFMNDIASGELDFIKPDAVCKIQKKEMWAAFEKWTRDEGHYISPLTRNKFYKKLQNSKVAPKPFEGIYYCNGFRLLINLN